MTFYGLWRRDLIPRVISKSYDAVGAAPWIPSFREKKKGITPARSSTPAGRTNGEISFRRLPSPVRRCGEPQKQNGARFSTNNHLGRTGGVDVRHARRHRGCRAWACSLVRHARRHRGCRAWACSPGARRGREYVENAYGLGRLDTSRHWRRFPEGGPGGNENVGAHTPRRVTAAHPV